MWGIIPAAGSGTRIQPLAFSKELLPVGSRIDECGVERPCAVSEYLIDRMIHAGVDKICFVISPVKSDIIQYFGGTYGDVPLVYVVQTRPAGLCDAIFHVQPLIGSNEAIVVGLPDTIWFPANALTTLPEDRLAFLLFPVANPSLFDSVLTDADGDVQEIQVKSPQNGSPWIWGAFRMPGATLEVLRRLWIQRGCQDDYVGSLVNAYLASGGSACGIRAGESYVDLGTLNGYREAIHLLERQPPLTEAPQRYPLQRRGLAI